MARKRVSNLPQHYTPSRSTDVGNEKLTYWDRMCQYLNLNFRIFQFISAAYGIFILYVMLVHRSGQFPFLLFISINGVVEYTKCKIYNIYLSDGVSRSIKYAKSSEKFVKSYICSFVMFYCGSILLGAQVFNKIEDTLIFCCTMTYLTSIPMILYTDENFLFYLCGKMTFNDYVGQSIVNVSRFTVVGAWFGAFVIPLDWDREWQQWPIPCIIGAYIGYIVGHLYYTFTPYLYLQI